MKDIVVTRYDQEKIIEVQPGDVIIFRLEENLTTGYGWEVETTEVPVVELIESTYIEAPGTAIGRGGTRVFRFAAKLPGIQEIRLRLRRPWDPPDRALEHQKVTIQVR